MSDKIDIEALVKQLNNDAEWLFGMAGRTSNEVAQHIRFAADALASLQAERDRLRGALATAKKVAQDYCWQRYKGREPLNLKSPAVFTSHEWQKIGEAIDAALSEEPSNG